MGGNHLNYITIYLRDVVDKKPSDFRQSVVLPYRFTTKYAIVIALKKSEMQNALRIPLNSDFQFRSCIVIVDTERKNKF